MPNILISTNCNLSCTYCFAKEKMQDKAHQEMSLDNVCKVISFLKRSGDLNFRMMGGEPTLHPQFRDILFLALKEGMHVDLLSNGTWPPEYNDWLTRISPSNLFFLLNIDHPDRYPIGLWKRIEKNLAVIGNRKGVSLSFNIFNKNPKFEYILDLAKTYNIHNIRLSFSLPVLGAYNERLDLEEYGFVSDFIIKFVRQGEDQGIEVRLDNAVPLCAFSYDQIGELILKGALDLGRNARCKPVVDIGPDLSVWCCFCLSKLDNRHLDEFNNIQDIQQYYQRMLNIYQENIFPMEKCFNCKYKILWGCQGGCITFSIERHGLGCDGIQQLKKTSSFMDENAVPILADNVHIMKYEIPKESYVLRNNVTGAEIEIGTGFLPLISLLDGKHTFRELVEAIVELNHHDESDDAMDIFERQIQEECYRNLLFEFLNKDFLALSPVMTN
jgi:MoaA/NifB/PqqE/SkfB family radical SAM enzyme